MPSGYPSPSDPETEFSLPPPDPLLRPLWEDTPDETDGVPDLGLRQDALTPPSRMGNAAWLPAEAVFALLAPLCVAQDALARLADRVSAPAG